MAQNELKKKLVNLTIKALKENCEKDNITISQIVVDEKNLLIIPTMFLPGAIHKVKIEGKVVL